MTTGSVVLSWALHLPLSPSHQKHEAGGSQQTNRPRFRLGRRSQSLTTKAGRLGTLSGFAAGDVWPYKDTSVFNPSPCN